MRRALILLWLSLPLGACSQGPVARSPEVTDPPADFPSDPFPGARGSRFQVIPAESLLQIKVFRGGRLAGLGHNHVISSQGLGGEVLLADEQEASRASLYLPVASLVVDDPLLRQAAGEGFEYPLSDEDREATRGNMLGDRLLNWANYPYIHVHVLGIDATGETASGLIEIRVLENVLNKQVPLRISLDGCVMSVSSRFDLRHAELGLQAFSVLGGALQVQDLVQVSVDVLARSRAPECIG